MAQPAVKTNLQPYLNEISQLTTSEGYTSHCIIPIPTPLFTSYQNNVVLQQLCRQDSASPPPVKLFPSRGGNPTFPNNNTSTNNYNNNNSRITSTAVYNTPQTSGNSFTTSSTAVYNNNRNNNNNQTTSMPAPSPIPTNQTITNTSNNTVDSPSLEAIRSELKTVSAALRSSQAQREEYLLLESESCDHTERLQVLDNEIDQLENRFRQLRVTLSTLLKRNNSSLNSSHNNSFSSIPPSPIGRTSSTAGLSDTSFYQNNMVTGTSNNNSNINYNNNNTMNFNNNKQ
ncbi:hypothetical protein ADEAN_000734300 [Angomonas deanei]|uniref:Uncharacterized protein n=1 Tax=Angomonas deanei TaxID=59799 RepID=A0A7G2CJ03_9TRYP|nr:hypothetical protein ADEAN_000734300 [Angomonas deanei]